MREIFEWTMAVLLFIALFAVGLLILAWICKLLISVVGWVAAALAIFLAFALLNNSKWG